MCLTCSGQSTADLDPETQPWEPVKPVEYSAGILGPDTFRRDVKPLQVSQPQAPSFKITDHHIEWQKWSLVLGCIKYDNRPLFYRVSMSGMTVPYGDPRSPYRRKQAFDLGDPGFGLTSNTLSLGCDCLGHIAYFSGIRASPDGLLVAMPNVVCMHERGGLRVVMRGFRNEDVVLWHIFRGDACYEAGR